MVVLQTHKERLDSYVKFVMKYNPTFPYYTLTLKILMVCLIVNILHLPLLFIVLLSFIVVVCK